jgi:GT2 family glycosyltransferase
VLVVDNGSAGSEASQIAGHVGARSVRVEQNLGFAGGVNRGLERSQGDVVALLNDDAVAGPDWLARSLAVLDDEAVAAVVPKLLLARRYAEVHVDDEPRFAPGDPRPLGRRLQSITVGGIEVLDSALGPALHELETGAGGRWRWTAGKGVVFVPLPDGVADVCLDGAPVAVHDVVDLVNNAGSYLSSEGHVGDYGYETPDRGAFDAPGECFSACGAAMVAPAEVFRRIGPFAAHFFTYYEDSDWSWRAQLSGMTIRYEPGAVVRHVRGATSGGERNPRVEFFATRNRLLTLARNAPLGVFARQLGQARQRDSWPLVRRSLARRIPPALGQRWLLSRRWVRSPAEVWNRWAGVGERWPASGAPSC